MDNRGADYVFKCVVIGDSQVGKTVLLKRYSGEPYIPDCRAPSPTAAPPPMDPFVKTIALGPDHDNKTVNLKIYDTLGKV